MKVFAILALCIATAAGGVVNVTRCDGVGTPIQTRISDCEGVCAFIPGQVYNCEQDFMPSAATSSLTLKLEACMNTGFCTQILSAELPNSSVQPGFIYTAKYSIVPNDILSGQTVEIRAYILHTPIQRVDVCVTFPARVL